MPFSHSMLYIFFSKYQVSMLYREKVLNKVTNISFSAFRDADRPPQSSATEVYELLFFILKSKKDEIEE